MDFDDFDPKDVGSFSLTGANCAFWDLFEKIYDEADEGSKIKDNAKKGLYWLYQERI